MNRKNFLFKVSALLLFIPNLFIKALSQEKGQEKGLNKKDDREFSLITNLSLFFGTKKEADEKLKDLKLSPFKISGTEEQVFNRIHLALATTFAYGYSRQNKTKQGDELNRLLKKYNISRESGITYEV